MSIGANNRGLFITNMPSEWQVMPLKQADCFSSKSLPENTDPTHTFSYVDISSVKYEQGIVNKVELSFKDAPSRARKIAQKDDTIISTVRTYLRSIATLEEDDELVVSTGFAVISPKKHNPSFLGFLLKSDLICAEVNRRAWGVAYPAVSESQIGEIHVPVPPLDEQQNIATRLKEKICKLDRATNLLQQQIEALETYKRSLIHEVVTKGLDPSVPMKDSGIDWIGQIPSNWHALRLKFVLNNFDYLRVPIESSLRTQAGEVLYPYYGASGIIDEINTFNVDFDSLLIGEDGANLVSRNLPLSYLATGKYWVNNHAHVLLPKNGDLRYYFYTLEAVDYFPFITGSAQPKLSQHNLNNVPLPVPPISEQQQIASYLDERCGALDRALELKRGQLELLKRQRKSLIFEYVTGKRRVSQEQ